MIEFDFNNSDAGNKAQIGNADKKKEADYLFENEMTDNEKNAVRQAMKYLLDVDKTRWQVEDNLSKKGYTKEEIEKAIFYVSSYGYVDDYRYAVKFITVYSDRRSINRIRADLKKRHVAIDTVEMALEEVCPDEKKALFKELVKILSKYENEDINYNTRQKIMAKAYQKGYATDNIIKVLDMILDERGDYS